MRLPAFFAYLSGFMSMFVLCATAAEQHANAALVAKHVTALKPPFMGLSVSTTPTVEHGEVVILSDLSDESAAIVDHFVAKIAWADLEPTEGNYEPGFKIIDHCIQVGEERNLSFNLRVLAGRWAPEWLQKKVGTVLVNDAGDKIEALCIKWWEPAVGDAYYNLMKALASRYDTNPRIKAVTMSRGMTIWPEPMQKQMKDPATRANLAKAGYSTELDRACDTQTLKTHAELWRYTYSSISVNPYQVLDANVKEGWRKDAELTLNLIDEAIEILGPRAVIQNSSLRYPVDKLGADYLKIYDKMKGLTTSTIFQTATIPRIGNVEETIRYAIGCSASSVEVDQLLGILSGKKTLKGVNLKHVTKVGVEEYRAFDKTLEEIALKKYERFKKNP